METLKILVEAGSTVILAITLLATTYFLSKSRNTESSAKEHDSNATQMTAKSNLLLAEALDRFSEAATRSAEVAATQQIATQRNYDALTGQTADIKQMSQKINNHAVTAAVRADASQTRDEATAQAIEALTGRIQLVMKADSNELMLQIEVALADFLSRLTPQEIAVEVNSELESEE